MASDPSHFDPPCYLDLRNECLQYGGQTIPLRPKTFAVLRCLLQQAGQLVSKDVLLDTVWPETAVSDGGLMVCIRELRRALGDDPKAPRFIETVHRRGYRFIGSLPLRTPANVPGCPPTSSSAPALVVAREPALARLHHWLTTALQGVRQVGFVTGEAGLGKSTLLEAFLASLTDQALWIAQGQCLEHYGAGEAYLPILEALGRLCRGAGGHELVALLAQQAPTWLVHMPGLLSPADLEALQRRVLGASRQRMLREFVEVVEGLTVTRPLLLVLEDLHWGDASTLDLLAALARRREPARFLLLATYRPTDATRHDQPLHALVSALALHGQCVSLPLTPLTAADVGTYLARRFPAAQFPAALASLLYQRTDGNPLFMVHVVESWIAQGVITQEDDGWAVRANLATLAQSVPAHVQQMLEQSLERCSPTEQQVLEVGSVAGLEFSAAAVAAGLDQDVLQTEGSCAALARRSPWLRASGETIWPDGTVAACYRFTHALCQEVAYSRVTAARRVHLHRRIGKRLEMAYGTQACDIAADLARHFERGRDARRALLYLRQAADRARQRYAHAEAGQYLQRGLQVLMALPDTPERAADELALQAALGPELMAIQGYAAPAVMHAYSRAHALCQQGGDTVQRFDVLKGLCVFYQEKAALPTARTLAEQLLQCAQDLQDPIRLLWAHNALGYTLFYMGKFVPARAHMEESLALYMAHTPGADGFVFDPGVDSLCALVEILYVLGYPDQALARSQEALSLAHQLAHPFSLAHAYSFAARLHRWRGEQAQAQTLAEASLAICHEQGFAQEYADAIVWHGSDLVRQGQIAAGLAQMRQGIEASRATGGELRRPWLLTALAVAYAQAGQAQEGLTVLDEALDIIETTGKRLDEAGLYLRKGELLMQHCQASHAPDTGPQWREAEACLHRALTVARQQQAKLLELRTATSLSRLWQRQGKRTAAHQLLATVYGWFTEGLSTAPLQEARKLLAECA